MAMEPASRARTGDERLMRRALELAAKGRGAVEPNPPVGAVVAAGPAGDERVVGEGWHARFGGPHAEVVALAAAGAAARGGTLVVTLEPCCHHGKTPPCTDAIIAAGINRVVVGAGDPFPAVSGAGIDALRRAGIAVEVGVCAAEARRMIAPFRRLVEDRRPWVVAKWAMSLDGRVATTTRESRWISSEDSRSLVHELRGRVDAILVGIGTALADDPLLTARPAGPRRAVRIVLDRTARLPLESRLVRSARELPVLVATGPDAPADRVAALETAGCEAWRGRSAHAGERLLELLHELGRRSLTTLLAEGGPTVLGGLADARLIDEVWAFIAPTIIGGVTAPAAVAGDGVERIVSTTGLDVESVDRPGGDVLVRGVVRRG
jgi:diaminohydroxyphosphoribosylaminopyrimidine deaminase/5-amino-6-(5-phosphoribosylamino)uracil reductase